MGVEFRILGPLEVLRDGEPVVLGGGRQRAVLAVLLLHAGEVVPAERLIDAVWDEEPPETARNVLQSYISQLRKSLRADVITTQGRGYQLALSADQLDLERFQRLTQVPADPAAAAASLREALSLWR
ncbi:MAG: winged helix-turn-helix domain-containing protein, partial [Actinomycetota bacterium]|nr:winged helix-turn-helix domain-containing protein [Actinomycetota bacterium]